MSNADLVQHLGLDPTLYLEAEASITAREDAAIWRLRHLKLDMRCSFIAHSGRKDSTAMAALVERAFPAQAFMYAHETSVVHNPKLLEHVYQLNRFVLHVPPNQWSRMAEGFTVQFSGARAQWHGDDLPLDIAKGSLGMHCVYPIYDWTDEDVWAYLITRNLRFSETYLPDKADHENSHCCPPCGR